ncbi:hypothetical protein BJ508DRAFT_307160 [Ascobolus immersus RN42]|uniref:Uncharacterized protein n=1 Tax=Ascobolus immersus RN42 TaxID=1160509 RepID=A0A3N4I7U6_ASCIM|nr:hypothetical protein BJ508DRAFT_307160 [Ascobolus immersus RN42]
MEDRLENHDGKPPFLSLPNELHDEIASNLNMKDLTQVRFTCKIAYASYEHKQTQRAAFRIWVWLQVDWDRRGFNIAWPDKRSASPAADNSPSSLGWSHDLTRENTMFLAEDIRKLLPGESKENCRASDRFLFECAGGVPELAALIEYIRGVGSYWAEGPVSRIMIKCPVQRIRDMLLMIGSWDAASDVCLLFRRLTRYHWRTGHAMHWYMTRDWSSDDSEMPESKASKATPKMIPVLAEQLAKLGPLKNEEVYSLMYSIISEKVPGYLKVLYGKGVLSGPQDSKQLDRYLQDAIRELKEYRPDGGRYRRSQRSRINQASLYELIKILLEQIGCKTNAVTEFSRWIDQESSARVLVTFTRTLLEDFISCANSETGSMEDEFAVVCTEVLELLVSHGLDLFELPVEKLLSPWSSNPIICGILANAGLHITSCETDNWTFFHRFCKERDIGWDDKVAEILVRQGADVNAQDEDGNTPLTHVLLRLAWVSFGDGNQKRISQRHYEHSEKIRFLLANGADPFIVNKTGLTAVGIAMVVADPFLLSDIIELDCQRQERYGALTPNEVYEKWLLDDALWQEISKRDAFPRARLEPSIVQLPQEVEDDEIQYLDLQAEEFLTGGPENDDALYKGWTVRTWGCDHEVFDLI